MKRSQPTVGWAYLDDDGPSTSITDLGDRALVDAARSHSSGFSAIIDRYYGSIVAVIRRICGPVDAEDLAQETFVRAFSRFDTFEFRNDHSLRTWLHRIAVNTAINALRSQNQRRSHEGPSLDEKIVTEEGSVSRSIPDVSTEPARLAERDETRRLVCDAIRSLSPKHRQALVMIDLEELQYSEAAAIIGCRMGTLKSRLSRARDSLAAKIRHQRNLPEKSRVSGETFV